MVGKGSVSPWRSFPHTSTTWQENNDSSLHFRRRFLRVRRQRLAFFLRPTKNSMEDHRLGMGLQLVIGLLVFQFPGSQQVFFRLNDAVLALLNVSKSGSSFLFGPLAAGPGDQGSIGFILIFQVLPVAIFFSAFTAALYHLRVLQIFVRAFAKIFHRPMGTSGAESLCGAANIFVGVESALVIRPYLGKMTRSELLTVLGTGMATVASSTLGIYVAFLTGYFPQIAGHLLSASIIAIPAVIVTT